MILTWIKAILDSIALYQESWGGGVGAPGTPARAGGRSGKR